MKTVFIIDNNQEYRETLQAVLEDEDVEVIGADCPDCAYRILETITSPDLIVCDLYMPFTTGLDADEYKTSTEVGLRTMHELAWVFPDTPVIALAGITKDDLARIRQYVKPIPAYAKTENIQDAAKIVRGFLESRSYGGVQ